MTLAPIVIAVVYGLGWRLLQLRLPCIVPLWKLIAFAGGIATIVVVTGSPLAGLDHHLLTAHMIQHLLLMIVAAPLVLLADPVFTVLHAFPRRVFRTTFAPILRSESIHWLGDLVTRPVVCWFVASFTVIVWHVPAVFDVAMRSHAWHQFQLASFFVAGALFWWPVVRPFPSSAREPEWEIPIYLFLATLPCDALSAYLTFCDRVVYPQYLMPHTSSGLSALQDQALAGSLMWITVTFAYLLPALLVTLQLLVGPRKHGSAFEQL